MSALFLFLIAVLVPLYFASPRTVPFWLSIEALALAWHVVERHGLHSTHAVVSLLELLLLRGVFLPWLLRRATVPDDKPVNHLLPSNLFTWILGAALVIVAFELAISAAHGETALTLGVVSATVVLAMLLLSSNGAAAAQLFALLLLENAVALFESSLPELWSPWVHAVLSCIYVLTVWVGVQLLHQQHQKEPAAEAARPIL
jgi:hypothetical protein